MAPAAPGRPPHPALLTGRQAAPAPSSARRSQALHQPRDRTGLGRVVPTAPGPSPATPPPTPVRAGKTVRFPVLSPVRSSVSNQRAASFARLPRRGPINGRGAALPIGSEPFWRGEGGERERAPLGPPPPRAPSRAADFPTPSRRAPACSSRTHRGGRRRDLRLRRPSCLRPGWRKAGRRGRGGGQSKSERPAAEKQDGGGSVRRRGGGSAPFPPGPRHCAGA